MTMLFCIEESEIKVIHTYIHTPGPWHRYVTFSHATEYANRDLGPNENNESITMKTYCTSPNKCSSVTPARCD